MIHVVIPQEFLNFSRSPVIRKNLKHKLKKNQIKHTHKKKRETLR